MMMIEAGDDVLYVEDDDDVADDGDDFDESRNTNKNTHTVATALMAG